MNSVIKFQNGFKQDTDPARINPAGIVWKKMEGSDTLVWRADPFTYPNGETVHVLAMPTKSGWLVSDGGMTTTHKHSRALNESSAYRELWMRFHEFFGVFPEANDLVIETDKAEYSRDKVARLIVSIATLLTNIQK